MKKIFLSYISLILIQCNISPVFTRCINCTTENKTNLSNETKKVKIAFRLNLHITSDGDTMSTGGFNHGLLSKEYLNILKNSINQFSPNIEIDLQCIADLKSFNLHPSYKNWLDYCGEIYDKTNLPASDFEMRVNNIIYRTPSTFPIFSIPFLVTFGLIPFAENCYHSIEFEIYRENELPLNRYLYIKKISYYSVNWLPLILTFMQFSNELIIVDKKIWKDVTDSFAKEIQNDIQ